MIRRRQRRRRVAAILASGIGAALLAVSGGAFAFQVYPLSPNEVKGFDDAMKRQVIALHFILNPYQMRQLLDLPDDTARREWIARYWKSQDPTPASEQNEIRDEHEIRMKLAYQFFRSKRWPGYDKRGEVFVRYGAPTVRAFIPSEVTARRVHAPGELWYYSKHDMVVVLRDESLSGHFVYAINAFGATQDMSPEMMEYLQYEAADRRLDAIIPPDYLDFYRDPETDPDARGLDLDFMDAFFGIPSDRFLRPRVAKTQEDIGAISDTDYVRNLPDNPSYEFIFSRAEEQANRFEETLEETPSSYPVNFDQDRYAFFFDISQFKGGPGVNRVEVNIALPVEPRRPEEVGERRIYQTVAVFFDADYNEVTRAEREVSLPVRDPSVPPDDYHYEERFAAETRLFPAQLVVSVPTGYYRVAVSATETSRGRGAEGDTTETPYRTRESAYRSTLSTRNYGDDLAISDLLFASKIAPIENATPYARGAIEVVPHPVRRYPVGTSVPVFFELYNLGIGEDRLTSYEIEYRIVPFDASKRTVWERTDGDATIVTSSFDGRGHAADEPIHITIRTENLKAGPYDLLIRVKDVFWQATATRQATFRLVKE